MPELPEVESVLRQLRPRLVGLRLLEVRAAPQARFSSLELAEGARVVDLRRRGKYLLAELGADRPRELVVHLGMTGALRWRGEDGWAPDAYVRATLLTDGGTLDFRDVRRFGRLSVVPAGDHSSIATLAALGPEPLTPAFTAEGLHRDLAASRQPVKTVLLGQRAVAGVGNIYADEALWRARIHPASRRVGRERAARLWSALRAVLAEAVAREGTTFRDYQMVNGASGRHADFLDVYGKEGRACPRCGRALRRAVVGGRGSTYCAGCQRP